MHKRVSIISVAVLAGLFLSSCGVATQDDVDKLKSDIRDLEYDVGSLEDEVKDLQDCLDDIVDLIEGNYGGNWTQTDCPDYKR